jgi:hypothetical protein
MNPWFETVFVVIIAVMSIILGRGVSRLRNPYWMLGYFIPCALIILLVIARFNNALCFVWPVSLIAAGRARFFVLSFAIAMGLTVPLSRLPRKLEKVMVCLLMAVSISWACVLPFLVPAVLRSQLASLTTRFDANGICRQSTRYTCGPAAAVTALKKLGLSAEEGQLAILSYTSPLAGTSPSLLCSALQNRYSCEGLRCRYRRFDSIEQLRGAGITLAVVKDAFLLDHCLAVLAVSDQTVTVADPIVGILSIQRWQFEKVWRFSGIVMERNKPA